MGAGRFLQGGFPPGTLPAVPPTRQGSVRNATPGVVGTERLALLAVAGSAVLVLTVTTAAFRVRAHNFALADRDRLQNAVKPGNPLHRVPPAAA